MKLFIFTTLIILAFVSSEYVTSVNLVRPNEKQMYRTQDVFDANKENNEEFNFFPYLDEFVTYAGWYRKADKKLSEEENLKAQISDLKENLYGSKDVDVKQLVKDKKVYDEKWLAKQLKIARILEIEDLLEKDAANNKL